MVLTLQERTIRVYPKYGQSDLDQESILDTSYATLFPFQEISPQDELYDVWHYPALKKRN